MRGRHPVTARPPDLSEHLGALAEPVRARIVRVLEGEELAVGELGRVLQLPQSTVSRHLKVLLGLGWIRRRTEGAAARVSAALDDLGADVVRLWELVRDDPARAHATAEDLARLASVLAAREVDSRAFFGRVAAGWDGLRDELFGQSFLAPTLLSLLPSDWTVVDLGCGTGELLARLAPVVGRVIGVDQEGAMLEAARRRLADAPAVDLVEADLAALPLDDACADAALCVLVLHHIPDPAAALAEARRVVRPGGPVVVLDMIAHDREAYRQTMGHKHLGFSPETLAAHAAAAGLAITRLDRLAPDPAAQGPGLFLARLVAAAKCDPELASPRSGV